MVVSDDFTSRLQPESRSTLNTNVETKLVNVISVSRTYAISNINVSHVGYCVNAVALKPLRHDRALLRILWTRGHVQ